MISAFTNTLKIPELRERILFTLAMVVVVRIGTAITLPGVDPTVLQEWVKRLAEEGDQGTHAVMALLNVFSGGALENCAVFALGIMPYISASIMMQLMTAVVPRLSKLSREDGGRQKIGQYTRYVAITLSVFQGFMLAKSLENPEQNVFLQGLGRVIEETGLQLVPNPGLGFELLAVLVIVAGTMLLMWIGDQITERGVGNGISLIITVNIIASLPGALVQAWTTYIGGPEGADTKNPMILVMMIALLLLVIAAVIAITQAQRRINIQYAKRVVGRKVYGGQSTFLPLKVNYSGVMPIIFAQAILLFPSQIIAFAFPGQEWAQRLTTALSGGWPYAALSALLIFFFSYFWVATMFQPNQIADDLKKNGGYIPGVRPGKPTAEFLDFTMSRLTFAGAIFLTVVFLLPLLVSRATGVPPIAAQFFGGTSILILVGVLLDMMRQVETHLLQRHYDGFLRKGKIRGRFERPRAGMGRASASASSSGGLLWIYLTLACLIVIGMAYYLYTTTIGATN
ncbi:MAG TPA: preprotein translocase subunit SecY [Verrucomicrobiales bacterium]|nr:preprotein translocase subunit SecY [Verrucomicrobiales bacterium]